MPTQPQDSEDQLKLELYKSLRQEAASYVEKVPGVWLQKFLFAGAVIAFVVQNHASLGESSPQGNQFLIFGFACVPVLAILLDVKIFEYTLHARAISRFIELQFAEYPSATAWERALWGGGPNDQVAVLTRWRSIASVVVTLVPTAILVLLAAVVIGQTARITWGVLLVAGGVDALYLGVGIRACMAVWPGASGSRR